MDSYTNASHRKFHQKRNHLTKRGNGTFLWGTSVNGVDRARCIRIRRSGGFVEYNTGSRRKRQSAVAGGGRSERREEVDGEKGRMVEKVNGKKRHREKRRYNI